MLRATILLSSYRGTSYSNLVNFVFTRAQTEAKRCVKNLIDSDCNFPSQAKEVLDLGFSDYNPFYADNRDPGATGSDQCDGVQDKSGDGLKYFNAGKARHTVDADVYFLFVVFLFLNVKRLKSLVHFYLQKSF